MKECSNELWEEIRQMLKKSKREIVIIEGEVRKGEDMLKKMKITSKSALGVIMLNTSGVIIDNWIRIFGQGGKSNRSIFSYNLVSDNGILHKVENMLVVADDIVGGMFALNTGRFKEDVGKVWYFAPDTLDWENLEMEYSEFLAWCACGNTDDFYISMRWKNWRKIARNVRMDEVVLVYPFLWAKEVNIESAKKTIVPSDELFALNMEYREKFNIS